MVDYFRSQQRLHNDLASKAKRRVIALSWVRVFVFLTMVVLFYMFLDRNNIGVLTGVLVGGLIIFFWLVKKQQKQKEEQQMHEAIAAINTSEIKRKSSDFEELNAAEDFLDEHHPYAYDLDIFGEHSIFQLINRAATYSGSVYVARNLLKPPPSEEVLSRQGAVKELKDEVEWRQSFQAYGIVHPTNFQLNQSVQDWLNAKPLAIAAHKYKLMAWALSIAAITMIVLIVSGVITYQFLFLLLGINAMVLLPHIKRINAKSASLTGTVRYLSAYEGMFKMVEKTEWQNEFLLSRKRVFGESTHRASGEITRLKNLMDYFDGRGNFFYQLLNGFFLFDIHLVHAIEAWKYKNDTNVTKWIDAVCEIELTSSLAAFSYANPGYAFPELDNETRILAGNNIGHPLIQDQSRICNDFRLSGKGAVALITGSNMAGKSTFLRTLGVNVVLAQLGSPVCADSFQFSACKVFTSMRTKDNLNESISSFYAELLRIKSLLETIDDNETTLYLLDEILKGTNSKDRHHGAMSLIKQLSRRNAFGLVSTHDLELGILSKEIKNLENYSFESRIEGDEIFFDYKLKSGLCESFNASKLMEKMGIEMGLK